jgi:hypothetical protein
MAVKNTSYSPSIRDFERYRDTSTVEPIESQTMAMGGQLGDFNSCSSPQEWRRLLTQAQFTRRPAMPSGERQIELFMSGTNTSSEDSKNTSSQAPDRDFMVLKRAVWLRTRAALM